MKSVQIREAKATFSALVDAASHGEATIITRHGVPAAVLVPIKDADRIYAPPKKSLAELLLSFPGDLELERDPAPMLGLEL